jgi:hypothetical protein
MRLLGIGTCHRPEGFGHDCRYDFLRASTERDHRIDDGGGALQAFPLLRARFEERADGRRSPPRSDPHRRRPGRLGRLLDRAGRRDRVVHEHVRVLRDARARLLARAHQRPAHPSLQGQRDGRRFGVEGGARKRSASARALDRAQDVPQRVRRDRPRHLHVRRDVQDDQRRRHHLHPEGDAARVRRVEVRRGARFDGDRHRDRRRRRREHRHHRHHAVGHDHGARHRPLRVPPRRPPEQRDALAHRPHRLRRLGSPERFAPRGVGVVLPGRPLGPADEASRVSTGQPAPRRPKRC